MVNFMVQYIRPLTLERLTEEGQQSDPQHHCRCPLPVVLKTDALHLTDSL